MLLGISEFQFQSCFSLVFWISLFLQPFKIGKELLVFILMIILLMLIISNPIISVNFMFYNFRLGTVVNL